jgi:hypothetical protein
MSYQFRSPEIPRLLPIYGQLESYSQKWGWTQVFQACFKRKDTKGASCVLKFGHSFHATFPFSWVVEVVSIILEELRLKFLLVQMILLAAGCSQWWEDFQILCVPQGRIHGRTCGCKWSFLKVREGKYKRGTVGPRWNLEAESVLLFSRCF